MRQLRFVFLLTFAASAAAQTRELTNTEQAAHALSRLTFGARPGDLERVIAMGVDAWIASQLHPQSLSDSAATSGVRSLPPWSKPVAELGSLNQVPVVNVVNMLRDSATTIQAKRPDSTTVDRLKATMARLRIAISNVSVGDQFAAGKIINAELRERQLDEVMADFWENHFSVYNGKQPSAGALPLLSRDAIRPRALGKFRDLLGAVAHSPSMLYYLDNHMSTAAGINENYARELLELHTLGVDGGYTQTDVIEVARALTGWGIDPPRPVPAGPLFSTAAAFRFSPSAHDSGAKIVLGHTLAAGRGVEDGEEVLDIIARHPSTARYIATKLARHFVSDTPPAALIDRVAATFIRTDGDITEVLRTIVTSNEFFSRAAFRAKIKTLFELVVSARRVFGAPADSTAAIVRLVGQFGQPAFGHLTPEGWPDTGDAWMNSGTMFQRTFFAVDVASGALKELPVQQWQGWSMLGARSATEQAEAVARTLLGGVASVSTLDALRQTTGDDGPARLRSMVALALASPDFQRR